MKPKYWVTMTDRAMSGWGLARGKTNKLVLACETIEEAEYVESVAHSRREMRYVNVTTRKPSYSAERYYVSWHDRSDYDAWYPKSEK